MTFTLAGFSTVKREGLELTTGFTASVNIQLRVGALEESVTVSGASPVVDVQSTRTQQVMTRDVLDALPNSKTFGAFTALIPGMTGGARALRGRR